VASTRCPPTSQPRKTRFKSEEPMNHPLPEITPICHRTGVLTANKLSRFDVLWLCIIALVCQLATFNLNAQQPAFLTNGLVAYYPFNGNANDESGNGNNGTPLNINPAKDRFDVPGGAFHFNGLDGQVTGSSMVVSNKIINIGQTGYAITFWFKPENVFQQSRALFNTIPHTGVAIGFNNNNSPGYVFLGLGPANAYWNILYLHGTKNDYQAGAWYCYALVKDGAVYRQYINGALEHEYKNPVASVYNYDVQLRFGSINEVNQFFGGDMDDIRVYNRAFSHAEVKSLYDFESIPPQVRFRWGMIEFQKPLPCTL